MTPYPSLPLTPGDWEQQPPGQGSSALVVETRQIWFKSQLCSSHLWDLGQIFKTLSLPLHVCKIRARLLTSSVAGRTEKIAYEVSSLGSCTWAFCNCGSLSLLIHPLGSVCGGVVLQPSLLGDIGWRVPCFHWKQGGHLLGPLALLSLALTL